MNNQAHTIRPSLQATLSYLILLSLLIISFNVLVNPALESRRDKLESIATLQVQNQRFLQSIAEYESQVSTVENDTEQVDDSQFSEQFLHAETSALAGAQLQALLRSFIQETDAELVTAAFRRSNEDTAFPQIAVNLRVQSSIIDLITLLKKIETHSMALFIENLVVQSLHRDGRVIRNINEELEIRMDVIGFLDMSVSGPDNDF